jgi:8-oxo-dGTP pyrophosphatase MutT (NUDIX family)
MAWQTLSTRTVYENPWIRVRQDEVIRPGGGSGIYGVVEMRHPAVFVVALDDEDRIVLVSVDRYTTAPASWEVPAGATDGEDPLVAARRELAEETGLSARQWTALGSLNALNGIAVAPEHVFLARDLHSVADAGASQAEEGIAEVRRVPFAEVVAMIGGGEIHDGETVAAVALAAIRLGRMG